MPKFLIEVPHEEERTACARAIRVMLGSGSHFLTNAEWGCKDGDHRGWFFVDVGSKEEALQILPPAYRAAAKIVCLHRFTLKEIDEILASHT